MFFFFFRFHDTSPHFLTLFSSQHVVSKALGRRTSSRSHTIFLFFTDRKDSEGKQLNGKLALVELASSMGVFCATFASHGCRFR